MRPLLVVCFANPNEAQHGFGFTCKFHDTFERKPGVAKKLKS